MAPARKKQKITASSTKYLCHGHDRERAESTFPDYNPSPDCDHLINYCKDCLKAWTKAQIEGNLFKSAEDGKVFGIQCPQCPAIMRGANVEIATDVKKVLQQFEDAERRHVVDNTPGWRWCLAAGCKAGQVHQKAPSKSKSKTKKAEPDICTCNECGARACVPCDRPWHEGESCTDYQARIKDKIEEEDKSIAEIRKVTKKCPHCQKSIQKDGGCPSMICIACKGQFCWDCAAMPCRCNRAREYV